MRLRTSVDISFLQPSAATVEEEEDHDSGEKNNMDETLPPGQQLDGGSKMIDKIFNQLDMETNEEPDFEFERAVDHSFSSGQLILKVNCGSNTIEMDDTTLDMLFVTLRKDVPVELAKCIGSNVMDGKRNGHHNAQSRLCLKAFDG